MADYLVASNNDWDLEAIIRGWGGGGGAATAQLPSPQGGSVLGFSESKVDLVNELEEMYKPFVPCSSSLVAFDKDDEVAKTKEDDVQARSSSKRRKSKQKIVREVHRGVGIEDGVAIMDKWNWRKYGQKAIKGSPYPRSYYRCSSPTGCQARKHVEQSKDDSHTCIVTYIADHSHLPPTRRHAQAGRKITKFASSSSSVVKHTPSPPSTSTMGDHQMAGDSSNGLEDVMKGMFSDFDQDFSWEFDPFFATSIC